MRKPLFQRGITVVALFLTLLAYTSAHAAIITTVTGERIVCEIVEEKPEYYIINHDGYRRYLLKALVRSIEDDPPILRAPNPMRHHSFGVISGYYRNTQSQQQKLSGFRVSYILPLFKHVAFEGTGHYGVGSVYERAGSKLLPGDMSWRGVSVGTLWNTQIYSTYWFVESALGYFAIDHTLKPSEKSRQLGIYRALETIPDGQQGDFWQDPENAFGLVFGGGFMYPLFKHLALEARTTLVMIDSRMRDVITFDPIADDQRYATGRHVNTYELFMEMAQFQVAIRWTFF